MKNALFSILIFLASASAHSHEPMQFIEKYLRDLDKNVDLSGYFVERPQFIFGHHIHIPDSAGQASDYVRDLQARLREQGYAKSGIVSTKVLARIEDYTLITYSIDSHKGDGKPLDAVCNTFGVVHLKLGYKILSWQPSEPNKNGDC